LGLDKGSKQASKPQEQKMTKEEKLNAKELKRLLKKLNKDKMPTMMYRANDNNKKSKREDDVNPW